jgi:hypothetical protein
MSLVMFVPVMCMGVSSCKIMCCESEQVHSFWRPLIHPLQSMRDRLSPLHRAGALNMLHYNLVQDCARSRDSDNITEVTSMLYAK